MGFGDLTKDLRPPGKNALIFRGDPSIPNHKNQYSEYLGNMTSFKELTFWIDKTCVPLVREVTFDNAEELSEEGLPFVLLFYNKDDLSPIQEFKNAIQSQMENETRVIFLTAEGEVFKHPLFHLGKSPSDLPVIAIDSFMHMYLFPRFQDIYDPGASKSSLMTCSAVHCIIITMWPSRLRKIWSPLSIQLKTCQSFTSPSLRTSSHPSTVTRWSTAQGTSYNIILLYHNLCSCLGVII